MEKMSFLESQQVNKNHNKFANFPMFLLQPLTHSHINHLTVSYNNHTPGGQEIWYK
jgi:hypothetical protein